VKKTPPNQFRVGEEEALKLRIPSRFVSDESFGMNGMFIIPFDRSVFRCVVSDGGGWEHVSVSLPHRTPTWGEMCFFKGIFWDAEECVVQFHPPASEYVNCHPFCLHLWKPTENQMPAPQSIMVGIKT
jgi:hypothetical protein